MDNAWKKLLTHDLNYQEEYTISNQSVDNQHFVRQFNSLKIDANKSDTNSWFQNNGPWYEHLNDDGIMTLINNPCVDGKKRRKSTTI